MERLQKEIRRCGLGCLTDHVVRSCLRRGPDLYSLDAVPQDVWNATCAACPGRARFGRSAAPPRGHPVDGSHEAVVSYVNDAVRSALPLATDFVEFLRKRLPGAVIAGGSLLRYVLSQRCGGTVPYRLEDLDVWMTGGGGGAAVLDAIAAAARDLAQLAARCGAPWVKVVFTMGTVSVQLQGLKVQFVYTDKAYTTDAIIRTFDIPCCQIALDLDAARVVVTQGFVASVVTGDVRVEEMPYVTRSLTRIQKYAARGFTFSVPVPKKGATDSVVIDFHVLAALCLLVEGDEHARRIASSLVCDASLRDVVREDPASVVPARLLCHASHGGVRVPVIEATERGNDRRAVLVDGASAVSKRPFLGRYGDPYVGFADFDRPLRLRSTTEDVTLVSRVGRDDRAFRVSVRVAASEVAAETLDRAFDHFFGLRSWDTPTQWAPYIERACLSLRVGQQCWMPRKEGYADSMVGSRLAPMLSSALTATCPKKKRSRMCSLRCCCFPFSWIFKRPRPSDELTRPLLAVDPLRPPSSEKYVRNVHDDDPSEERWTAAGGRR